MRINVSLYPHQIEAVDKMHNGCILCGAVGTGKSRTALAYYALQYGFSINRANGTVGGDYCSPARLYIITTAKKRDSLEWEDECLNFLINKDIITIDSWNNIKKYRKVYGAFFIFDEQRVISYGAWTKAFLDISRKNKWIMLSATPGDTWSDYIPVFIANGFYRHKSEFINRHVVYSRFSKYPKIDKYIDTGILNKYRHSVLVNMPFKRRTTAHYISIPCEYNKELYKKTWRDRLDPYKNEPVVDAAALCYLLRHIVNSDKSRLEPISHLIDKHQRLIIFYNYNYELDALREYLAGIDNLEVREWNGQKHEEVPDGPRWVYLVQYNAGAEGWNCVTTDAIVFYSQSYSYRMTAQAAGRIDRLNTKYVDLYYYVLRSLSPIDLAIQRALKSKKNFNEKAFVGK